MKSLSGYYGSRSGTNRAMAASIVEHCKSETINGGNLEDELDVVEGIYKQCYPGCGEDSEEDSEH